MSKKKSFVETQLMDDGMSVINVEGDENYLFRAASLIINETQFGYAELRKSVVYHIQRSGVLFGGVYLDFSPHDGLLFDDHINLLRTTGTAVGQDAIITLAEV